jgi:hypothetical protein
MEVIDFSKLITSSLGVSCQINSKESMTTDPTDVLDGLADQVAEEFEAHRQPDEFKDVSLVIDNNDPDRPTLIVHVDKENADTLADEIEDFLQERGARTQRERHSDTDVRVLATVG